MNTPIYDFVTKYCEKNPSRFHMPGHKGINSALNIENRDITEIEGAGNLWDEMNTGIIAESESNASLIFGCPTFYSTEGSSLAIRGMLFLIKKWASIHDVSPLILAGRNAHKTFVNTSAVLDIPVKYFTGKSDDAYLSCNITVDDIQKELEEIKKDGFAGNKNITPIAVYITTPDYLGNLVDVGEIARVCHENGIFLLVDNAHGAYLKFLDNEKCRYPIDLGADMCCDSAHKTLPALTGAAYLHISNDTDEFFAENAKSAMGLFGSTSPSYLILQSLDLCNRYLAEDFGADLKKIAERTKKLKEALKDCGYTLAGKESVKVTLDAKKYGYCGSEIENILLCSNIYPEHVDDRYVVLMLSPKTRDEDIENLLNCLKDIPRQAPIDENPENKAEDPDTAEYAMSPHDAIMADSEIIRARNAAGRILSEPVISCPPCVPLYMAGEIIKNVPKECEYIRVVRSDK